MQHIIDISWPISTVMTAYKDKSVVDVQEVKNFAVDGARETTVRLSCHSGTHIDAPSHFLKNGKTIDQLQLQNVIGACVVFDITDCSEGITRDFLLKYDDIIQEGSIVLFKTSNSDLSATDTFNTQFIYLQASGALYLAEKKIKAIGIDYLGVERNQPGHPTHKALMNADITVIEGLRLGHVKPGSYFFIALPLYFVGLEAAPARAILMYE